MKLEPVKKPYGMMNEMRCYTKEEKIHIKTCGATRFRYKPYHH